MCLKTATPGTLPFDQGCPENQALPEGMQVVNIRGKKRKRGGKE